ncbi:ATP-binding cassette domain-containing protein [Xylophilus sp. Kf1]|nr:ATP-binding cassette domain-containing protein [Xylophilus sp. Kf1]
MQKPTPTPQAQAYAQANEHLHWAIDMVMRQHGAVVDPMRMREILSRVDAREGLAIVNRVMTGLGHEPAVRHTLPDRTLLPMLVHMTDTGWGVLADREPDGRWRVDTPKSNLHVSGDRLRNACVELRMNDTLLQPIDGASVGRQPATFTEVLVSSLHQFHGSLAEAFVASVFIGLLALITSLFSMQVYDRVIPTKGQYTLVVLSIGVTIGIVLELLMKFARSNVMDHVTVGVDNRLSPAIFQRLLHLRVDQLPASVGSLVSQLRGYEQVRGFYTASTLFAFVDVPMGLIFLFVIATIASPIVALVALVMALVALAVGVLARKRVMALAAQGAQLSNMKTGLLVEAVEGVETIKAGSGGWKFLSRWTRINATTIHNDLKLRGANESTHFIAGAIQQLGYMAIIVVGALLVMQGDMTTGALIACSILSGRIIAPILALPGLIVQHAHARAALDGLNRLYALKTDNHGVDRVLIPERLLGNFRVDGVRFSYGDNPVALHLPALVIRAGERVGIVGSIGSGKSTLLRLLSGMYAPAEGRVLIDGLDISHVSREVINRQMGYLQQEHRLFQGTLRENLLIGMPDPGDEVFRRAMRRSGMDRFVQSHPKGLDRLIAEGGKGLSGGQRQLLAFTRLILANPCTLLLDEPTANMDHEQEKYCLDVIAQEAAAGKTIVIVTHKPALLPLVDRLIVINGSRLAMDGPRDEVLRRMSAPSSPPSETPAPKASGISAGIA